MVDGSSLTRRVVEIMLQLGDILKEELFWSCSSFIYGKNAREG